MPRQARTAPEERSRGFADHAWEEGLDGFRRVEQWVVRAVEAVLVLLLAGMVVMVFTNVVLRYGFNSGLTVSEEMSRYFFVWLTFIGAVLAFRDHAHLGVETVVRRLGPRGRLVCVALSNAIILLCAVVLVWGTWRQHAINASMTAPVVGLSMIWVFGVTYVTGLAVGAMALARLVRALLGRVSAEEMARITGEYEPGEVRR
ncbi:TRAP transporter small permease subunit [Rubellimicrobium sp. CFH 75288]|nr:TRAP transporter small permease subunit [Rubellimicrobium sp. CFH 75288]